MRKNTFIFLIDALRHDYLTKETTPFLFRSSKTGFYIKKIKPSYGFCERTELLTGQKPSESEFLTAIGYNPDQSEYKNDRILLNTLSLFEKFFPASFYLKFKGKKLSFKILFRKLLNKLVFFQKHLNPYLIPYDFLSYFTLTEDKFDHFSLNMFNSNSLIDFLYHNNLSFDNSSFTSLRMKSSFLNDKDRINNVLSKHRKTDSDIYFIYLSLPDLYGHQFGPGSKELNKHLFKMDKMLESFVIETNKISKNNFLFIGDHGMLKVEKEYDFEKELLKLLASLKLKRNIDFIYFIDSTIVRIWFLKKINYDVKSKILYHSEFLKHGFFPDKFFLKENNLPQSRKYGDILWFAKDGVLVFPNFFNNSPVKGMHGYNPANDDSKGCFIAIGENIDGHFEKEEDLSNLFDIQKKLISKFQVKM